MEDTKHMLIAPESRGRGGSRWPPQSNNKDQRSSRVKVKENGGKGKKKPPVISCTTAILHRLP